MGVQHHGHSHDENEPNYLNAKKGIMSWLFTLDHKRIGIMYLISIAIFFLVGGLAAVLLRTELWTAGDTIMKAKTYNQTFTMHGAIMVFLVIIPGIPASLGNFVLPLMLGAKDVAFPRLNLMSYYIYVLGAIVALVSLATGAVDTGWTFYTPYSTTTDGSVVLMVTAAFILGFSSIFTGINFVATVHKLRAPGMTWFHMPLFVWGIYATAIIQIMATPVLAITLLLLIVERTVQVGIFDPKLGGDPVLFQHFFWFYSHPAVYIMILPGMAIVSELITTFTQKTIFGYKAIAYSSIAIAVISFLVWGHHMFVSGQSELVGMIFSALTFLVAIPSGIKMFNWAATMYKGTISLETPMLWALGFLFLFAIGGLTGCFLGTLAVDVHLHDTYFVVAHFHYVMVGGTFMAFMGGIFYWWPKMTGRMYNETCGVWSVILVVVGFNLTFFVQFVMGSQGMPRRYYHYLEQFQIYHQISTVGSYLLGFGFVFAIVTLLVSLKNGKKAPTNPWHAATLEWTETASPPIEHNFHHQPTVDGGPYEYSKVPF
ncbi:MAG: cytochrome c oxidase subunit I [bacterium]|nr:cytochrome c oxidase subunit I [bacterium]